MKQVARSSFTNSDPDMDRLKQFIATFNGVLNEELPREQPGAVRIQWIGSDENEHYFCMTDLGRSTVYHWLVKRTGSGTYSVQVPSDDQPLESKASPGFFAEAGKLPPVQMDIDGLKKSILSLVLWRIPRETFERLMTGEFEMPNPLALVLAA